MVVTTSGIHGLTSVGSTSVADVSELEWTTTILVTGELGDSSLGVVSGIELDDAGSTGATVALVLDLSLLDWANGGEEIDEILVAG